MQTQTSRLRNTPRPIHRRTLPPAQRQTLQSQVALRQLTRVSTQHHPSPRTHRRLILRTHPNTVRTLSKSETPYLPQPTTQVRNHRWWSLPSQLRRRNQIVVTAQTQRLAEQRIKHLRFSVTPFLLRRQLAQGRDPRVSFLDVLNNDRTSLPPSILHLLRMAHPIALPKYTGQLQFLPGRQHSQLPRPVLQLHQDQKHGRKSFPSQSSQRRKISRNR